MDEKIACPYFSCKFWEKMGLEIRGLYSRDYCHKNLGNCEEKKRLDSEKAKLDSLPVLTEGAKK